jgi:hypothetical protein
MKKLTVLLVIFCFFYCACNKEEIAVSFTTANQRFRQSSEWNSRNPAREINVPSDNYTILCMGDSHVGGTQNLEIFLDHSKAVNASAVVMIGDLTTGREQDYDLFVQCIPSQHTLPSFCLVGNHDLYYDGWSRFYSRFGSSTYFFTMVTPKAKDLFICLDTASGTLGNEQIAWLRKVLQSMRSNYRQCIVFTHNNLFLERHIESAALSVDELDLLLDLFAANKVNMVITGHDHNKAAKQLGITLYITIDALKDGLSNSGYIGLDMKNGVFSNSFQSIPNSR